MHITEMSTGKSELRCLWAGLFSILNSRHGKSSTKLDGFDEECRKIQKESLIQTVSKAPSDEKIMQKARTSLEVFIDQMFVDGRKRETSNDQMEVLSKKTKHKLSGNVAPSRKLPQRRSKAGDDCKFFEVERPGTKLETKSDIPCLTESVRRKIDLSSSRFVKKKDLVKLKNLNAMNKTSVKAPQKNPSSKEEFSQRRVRLSRHSNASSPDERQKTCLSSQETKIIVDSKVSSDISKNGVILSLGEDDMIQYNWDSVSENETITSTVEDVPYTPTSILCLKSQEHQSPVSVLEKFFTEDRNHTFLQTERKRLRPTRLYFEERPIEQSPQDYIYRYVCLVLQASCLNWDRILKTCPRPQKLLQDSLFDEVKLSMPCDYFDPKLLFDHVNEVLVRIQRSRFSFFPRPVFVEKKNSYVTLEELVLDEIKAEEFCLRSPTEERTVGQLVASDLSGSGSWIDVRMEAEYIVIQISERILQESVVGVFLGFCS